MTAQVKLRAVESAAGASVWTRSLLVLQQAREIREARGQSPANRLVRAGWLIAVVGVALQTAAQLVDAFVLAHAQPGLDAAVDRNAFDWMSFSAAMVAAMSLLLLTAPGSQRRGSSALLALLVAFLAVDDLTNLHDGLGNAFAGMFGQPIDRLGDWSTPVVYLPLLVLTFGLLCLRCLALARAPACQIRTALVLLAADVALRLLVGLFEIVDIHASEGIRAIGITVLEGAELGAWILVASAFAAEAADLRSSASCGSRRQRPEVVGEQGD
jgi:hypothetical protein